MSKVQINGVEFSIASSKKAVTSATTAFYPKAQRDKLDPDKLNDLFNKAVATSQLKYNFIDQKVNDPELLEDTYNLEMLIETTRVNHTRFDMHDVFTIVEPNSDPTKFKFTDLYRNHSSVTEAQVAASNAWYQTMTENPQNNWCRQNMNLTRDYMLNNVEEKLIQKVNETYLKYPMEERGGPLFFKIMIGILQNDSKDAAEFLINKVKTLNISTYEGENIETVVSLIRGAIDRLENLRDENDKSYIPDDFHEDLYNVFQTTSVPEFNDLFAQLKRSAKLSSFVSGAKAQPPKLLDILSFAEREYRKLYRTHAWTGINTKLQETSFIADTKGFKCFNCGGDHSLNKCLVPKDDARIKANRKLFHNKRRDKKQTKTKWKPPTDEEKKNNNRRMIDGKEYFYYYQKRRWKPVKKNSNMPNQVNLAFKEKAQTVVTQSAPRQAPDSVSEMSLTTANRSKRIEDTLVSMKNLLANFE